MKNKLWLWTIFFLIIVIAAGSFLWFGNMSAIANKCVSSGGEWSARYKECTLYGSSAKEICLSMGGRFNACGSACGHDSTTCIMMCVPVCSF